MHPILVGRTAKFKIAFAHRTEPFDDPFRRDVIRPNEARGPLEFEMLE